MKKQTEAERYRRMAADSARLSWLIVHTPGMSRAVIDTRMAEERFGDLIARVNAQGFVFDSHGCGYDVYVHVTNDDRMRVYKNGQLFHDSGQGYKKVALPAWPNKEAE